MNNLSKHEFFCLKNLMQNRTVEKDDIYTTLCNKGYIINNSLSEFTKSVLGNYEVKRAIFLAAGFGSGMVPITINTPKPLVRINNTRIIDTLIDACLKQGINEIYIVRGYLGEQFDQLLYKYPMIKFIDNPYYSTANNISSILVAKDLLSNAYVFESDLYLSNADIISKYHYTSNFLAIYKDKTNDWCFSVNENNVITEEKTSGTNCWQMVGISYWNHDDGVKLQKDIEEIYHSEKGTERYWEQVPLVFKKDRYQVEITPCNSNDIVEIDTFKELVAIDSSYTINN